jgi:hypothetical protein
MNRTNRTPLFASTLAALLATACSSTGNGNVPAADASVPAKDTGVSSPPNPPVDGAAATGDADADAAAPNEDAGPADAGADAPASKGFVTSTFLQNGACLPQPLIVVEGALPCTILLEGVRGGCDQPGLSTPTADQLAPFEASLAKIDAAAPPGALCALDQLAAAPDGGGCANGATPGWCYVHGGCGANPGACAQAICTDPPFDRVSAFGDGSAPAYVEATLECH